VHPQLSWQQPGRRGQNRSIWPRGAWLADLVTQDRDLVSQHQQLGSDHGLAVRKDRQPPEQAHHDQIEESEAHDRRSRPILIFPYPQVNRARGFDAVRGGLVTPPHHSSAGAVIGTVARQSPSMH
jgi:hypothetical protein